MSKKSSTKNLAFGIDIGGSGIKGAPVDVLTGKLAGERVRIATPQPSTPAAVAATVSELLSQFDVPSSVPVGVAFPGPITHNVVRWIANLDQTWTGTNLAEVIGEATGREVHAANDADAAGYAEICYGAAQNVTGVVVVSTLGTGIGSALFTEGRLVPNTEFGHLPIDGESAEIKAAASAREREALSWEEWAARLQRYYSLLELMLWPDLIVVGGGVSKKHQNFLPLLDLRAPIVPAQLRNEAGIVGAAALAHKAATKAAKAAKKATSK